MRVSPAQLSVLVAVQAQQRAGGWARRGHASRTATLPQAHFIAVLGRLVASGLVEQRLAGDSLPSRQPRYELRLSQSGREALAASLAHDPSPVHDPSDGASPVRPV